MDTDSFAINIFTEDFSEDINNDFERLFDTSDNDDNDKRPLPMRVNKKVIGMFNQIKTILKCSINFMMIIL